MTKRNNRIKLVMVLVISVLVSFLLLHFDIIDAEKVREEGTDFQYNVISTSAIIGGFLFTGISVLISVVDKERIKRLWENHYFDNLYLSAFFGMILNAFTIIIAIIDLCVDLSEKTETVLIKLEVSGLLIGLVFFIWCIKKLFSVVSKIKPKN